MFITKNNNKEHPGFGPQTIFRTEKLRGFKINAQYSKPLPTQYAEVCVRRYTASLVNSRWLNWKSQKQNERLAYSTHASSEAKLTTAEDVPAPYRTWQTFFFAVQTWSRWCALAPHSQKAYFWEQPFAVFERDFLVQTAVCWEGKEGYRNYCMTYFQL